MSSHNRLQLRGDVRPRGVGTAHGLTADSIRSCVRSPVRSHSGSSRGDTGIGESCSPHSAGRTGYADRPAYGATGIEDRNADAVDAFDVFLAIERDAVLPDTVQLFVQFVPAGDRLVGRLWKAAVVECGRATDRRVDVECLRPARLVERDTPRPRCSVESITSSPVFRPSLSISVLAASKSEIR